MMNPDYAIHIYDRSNELIAKIKTINAYDKPLRIKYYPVLQYSIKLLLQYTIMLNEYEEELKK